MAADRLLAPHVAVNPERLSGEPTVLGRRIATARLYDCWAFGDDWPEIARAYDVDEAQWAAAVAFEAGRRYEREKRARER